MADTHGRRRGLTRRGFLGAGAASGAATMLGGTGTPLAYASGATAGGACSLPPDVILQNGQIHTMDGDDRNGAWTVVSAVAIKDGRFLAVGGEMPAPGPDTQVYDLQGHTVIPGLIETHTHVILLGLRPNHHTPLENAFSIADVQHILAARREGRNPWGWWADFGEIPAGRWITSIGGWSQNLFAERRMPVVGELDEAVADRPILLFQGFLGPAVTNSMGKAFFESQGILVGDDGHITGAMASRAVFALYDLRTFEDELQGHRDMMAYVASHGLTTNFDQAMLPTMLRTRAGGAPDLGMRNPADFTYIHNDDYAYDNAVFELDRRGELKVRIRVNYLHAEEDPDVPLLTARLNNVTPHWGNDMIRIVGIGEWPAGQVVTVPSPAWVNATRKVAAAGWRNENHGILGVDCEAIITGWEAINEVHPIGDLRWVLSHAIGTNEGHWDRLADMGAAINFIAGSLYQGSGGFPFRRVWDHGIKSAFGADGANGMPLNPWQNIFHAVTGRNVQRQLTNDGQQVTRAEALRWYTSESSWFTSEEDSLGSIKVGNHADLAVLNEDYFTIDEDRIDRLHSILTVVGGNIAHDAGILTTAPAGAA